MKILTVLFLSLVMMYSCSDLNKKSQLSKIEQLDSRTDSLLNELKNNQLDSARQYFLESMDIELRIKNYYTEESLNVDFSNKMTQFKNMRKSFKKMYLNYDNLILGCKEIKESLRQLKHDIENGDGDRAKYNDYLDFEQSKFKNLDGLAKDYFESKNSNMEIYRELFTEIRDLSLAFQKKNSKKI